MLVIQNWHTFKPFNFLNIQYDKHLDVQKFLVSIFSWVTCICILIPRIVAGF